MINDLDTPCPTIKYVDDTTIYHASNSPTDSTLQTAVDSAINWSKSNSMRINASKTKEMLICFKRDPPTVPKIKVDGCEIERVESCTLLGIQLNSSLTWNEHIDKVYKRANQRLHFIAQLKRTKVDGKDMVAVYTSLIRPILEYACQLWHGGLNKQQEILLESIQERALSMAFPSCEYTTALQLANITSLYDRREELCKRLFISAQDESHKIHGLLPPQRTITHNQRHASKYPLPKVKTQRFKGSFINHCLFHQWLPLLTQHCF